MAYITNNDIEFIPEIWALIKEYAVQTWFFPIQIGETFVCYKKLKRVVELCVRVEDTERSLEMQKITNTPILLQANYRVIQTLSPAKLATQGPTRNRTCLSRLDKTHEKNRANPLFFIRRYVDGEHRLTKYWDHPDRSVSDKVILGVDSSHYSSGAFCSMDTMALNSAFQVESGMLGIVKRHDPRLRNQIVKSNIKKLTRDMFEELFLAPVVEDRVQQLLDIADVEFIGPLAPPLQPTN
tara:strand:+ start:569 stop:1285 length:717 start_codon:yes stop_codon:yes gene_type:complete